MASSSDGTGAGNLDQVSQTMKAVSEVLKTAGEKAVEGNRELAQCVMKQAQQNVSQLLETLQTMSASRDPAEVATLYTRFITESAQSRAQQLMELGRIMAQSGQQSWNPVAAAIMSAAKPNT